MLITKDNPQYTITKFAHTAILVIGRHGTTAKIHIQEDGRLLIVARSVAEAGLIITRTQRASGIQLADISDIYYVRFWATDMIAAYRTNLRSGTIEPGEDTNGMIIAMSSPELVHRQPCSICGQEPLHHRRGCANFRH